MKKITAVLLTLTFLVVVPVVLADTPAPTAGSGINFTISSNVPGAITVPAGGVGVIVNNAVKIIFAAATFLVLVFLIIGAFQWIMSGGDKEAVGKARGKITHALIGFAILALAFVILSVVGQILGTGSLLNFNFPSLTQ